MRPRGIASLLFVVAAMAVGYGLGAGGGNQAERGQVVTPATSASGKAATVTRGPRGPRGPRGLRGLPGPRGPRGPEGQRGGDAIADLTINWRNGAWNGRDTAQLTLTDLGTLHAECRPVDGNENGQRRMTMTPARDGVRTVATVSAFEAGEVRNQRYVSTGPGEPISFDQPVNGMLSVIVSIEPVSGDGGAGPTPWSFTASSEMKLNGPGGAASGQNFCYVAVQAARGQ